MLSEFIGVCRMQLNKLKGLTLVELLVALAINIFLLSALVLVFSNYLRNYNLQFRADTLNQQMEVAMQVMLNDIRRAGYNSAAITSTSNPFTVTGSTDLTVSGGNCITFTYDHRLTGTLPSISSASDDSRYGFRLSGGAIQSRPAGATFSCAAAASAWENLTDPNIITITALSFTINSISPPSASSVRIRTVTISMTGQLVSDATVTKTLTQTIRVRNDKAS